MLQNDRKIKSKTVLKSLESEQNDKTLKKYTFHFLRGGMGPPKTPKFTFLGVLGGLIPPLKNEKCIFSMFYHFARTLSFLKRLYFLFSDHFEAFYEFFKNNSIFFLKWGVLQCKNRPVVTDYHVTGAT